MHNSLLQPSHLNSHFTGDNLPFDQYLHKTQIMIRQARPDLDGHKTNHIVLANCPFEWRPVKTDSLDNAAKIHNGVLLIHGLSGSPFSLYDIGKHFLTRDFLVRSILLPGHGTVPGDLLETKYQEWIKAANYGVAKLAEAVDNIYIVGHSLGGALALHEALQHPAINGLILFAPALAPRSKWAFASNWHKTISWAYPNAKWIHNRPASSYAKYSSLPFNAAHQCRLLMKKIQPLIEKQKIKIPLFIVITSDDETIQPENTVNFFLHQHNPNSRMLIYSNTPQVFKDPRITVIKSAFPERKILNFSHPCLPIAPEHPHFGEHGDYRDFSHYESMPNLATDDIYLGATTAENLKQHIIQRLGYNPDFHNMMYYLDTFIDRT